MLTLMMILLILASAFLILLVLLQPGKADMGSSFGGAAGQMGVMFGMQKTANLLATITKVTAAVIILLVLVTNRFVVPNSDAHTNVKKVITEGQAVPKSMPSAPVAPAHK
jgi:protein translocase SecG subunit